MFMLYEDHFLYLSEGIMRIILPAGVLYKILVAHLNFLPKGVVVGYFNI